MMPEPNEYLRFCLLNWRVHHDRLSRIYLRRAICLYRIKTGKRAER